MSRRLRDLVYETALPAVQRIVLGALVWHVNAKRYAARGDTVVWPSTEELMARSRLSRNAVRRALAALLAVGVIAVVKEPTANTSTQYRVVVPTLERLALAAAQEQAARTE